MIEDFEVNQYQLDLYSQGIIDIVLQRYRQKDGSSKWAIIEKGFVLNKSSEWEYEPIPSSRNAAYFARTRFESAAEAFAFWKKSQVESRFEHYRK